MADFEERRDRLARALVVEDADAFVVEPGYTFKYYANVSQPEWEVWEVGDFNIQPQRIAHASDTRTARRTPIPHGGPAPSPPVWTDYGKDVVSLSLV